MHNDLAKSQLRKHYKNIRNNIDKLKRNEKSDMIRKNFENFIHAGQSFFVYKSYLSEVETKGIIKDLFSYDKKVTIPKCDIETETMSAVEIFANNSFKLNSYGICESSTDDIYEEEIDVVILPGLVFDRKGNRIGYGKGYYDKFINSLNYKPLLVGLCFDEQLIDNISVCDEHDAKLDYIITDKEFLKIMSR